MAREYGFTPKEKQTYYQQQKLYSSFGRDLTNDYIVLCVYGLDDVLIGTKILTLQEVNIDDDFVDINIGQHLRNMGLRQGEFRVVYKFLRRLAGKTKTIFVDNSGKEITGKFERKIINGEVRYFKSIEGETQSGEQKEVYIQEQKYLIDEISQDNTEASVKFDQFVPNSDYKNDLMEMNSLIQYKPMSSDNSGKIKFNNDNPYVLEFDINSQDRGFTQNMVGGQIIIPRLYKVTGNEDVTNEDLSDETDEFDESSTFIDAYLTDESVLDYSTQDLIDIIQTGTEEEQFYADQALQERAADRDY